MTNFTEGRHPGEGLLSEANPNRSRGVATIPAGTGKVEPGTVLGKITGDVIDVTKTDIGGGKGALTLADPAYGAGVKHGTYRIVIIEPEADGGDFVVEDPSGVVVGNGSVGAAFDGVIKFTLADAATDFEPGDTVLVHVDRSGSGGFVPSADAEVEGSEGAEVACAIALYGCDATDAAQKIAIIERDAEWNGHTLTFDDSVDDADKKAAKAVQLSSVGIIVRY